jgi:hypothetical protein
MPQVIKALRVSLSLVLLVFLQASVAASGKFDRFKFFFVADLGGQIPPSGPQMAGCRNDSCVVFGYWPSISDFGRFVKWGYPRVRKDLDSLVVKYPGVQGIDSSGLASGRYFVRYWRPVSSYYLAYRGSGKTEMKTDTFSIDVDALKPNLSQK